MTTTAVRVALRVRPLLNDCNDQVISFVKDEPQIYIGPDNRSFTFDSVYTPSSTQEDIYKSSILPLLDTFTEGKNATVLAYGQTGSGKTYTMGTGIETNTINQGIINRFANSLFERMIETSSKSLGRNSFEIFVSYLEIYNEDMIDLLNVSTTETQQFHPSPSTSSVSSDHPSIREDVQGNIIWTGIKEEKVNSVNDLLSFLKKGTQRRTTASTDMNASSSRSHAIFSILLKQHIINDDLISLIENDIPTIKLVSKFHFVDLAGSERLKKTNALGDRQKEGIFINGGLLALGNVISALGDESRRKNQHVPYRDSKLTRLLQDSLGGNSHTLMIACVSPFNLDYTETLNTLKYANRARNIQNRVEINQYINEETSYLRLQVHELKEQITKLSNSNTNHENDEIKLLKQEMNDLKLFSEKISRELTLVQSERDTLILKLEAKNQRPIQIPQIKQNDSSHITGSHSNTIHPTSSFIDNSISTKRIPHSTSSSRRLNNKKRPVIHRMKSTHSSSLLKKKNNQATMDELLDLLRKEYLLAQEDDNSDTNEKSIDETVLHISPGIMTMEDFSFRQAEQENTTIKKIMPDNNPIFTPPPILDEDELESLSVPSWSDAPKSINGTSKRKSISLDSMWDDTDSSITTSRIASTTTYTIKSPNNNLSNSKSKDMKRQSRNLLKMLHQIQADLLVKRELVGQLEKSEDQYSQMKINYEEKLNELKSHLFDIKNQRDAALKKSGTIIVPDKTITSTVTNTRPQSVLQLRENRQAQEVRSQYEVKLKRLVTENSELRKKNIQSTQSIQLARTKAEGIIGRLRADIEALKMDKKQLNKGLKIETDKSREAIITYEREIQQLKRRELVALESKKKLEQLNEAQNQVIKKRTEETAAVNLQIRQLTNVLRKAANEGTFLNEVTLERLLNDIPSNSPSPKNMRRPISRILGNSSATSIE